MRVLHQLARFVATKHHVEFFGELLQQQGLPAAMVYGTMDQTARQEQANQPKWSGNPSFLSISTIFYLYSTWFKRNCSEHNNYHQETNHKKVDL